MIVTLLALAIGMAPLDSYTFEPEGKDFRVKLPGKPDSTSSRTLTRAAGPAQLTTAELTTSNASYLIQVTENRGQVDPKTLNEGIQRFIASRNATLGSAKEIAVGGHPGRDFEMSERTDQGLKRSKMRWVVSGNSLYMLTVAGNPGAKLPADADRFLGSLEIGPAGLADADHDQDVEVDDEPTTGQEPETVDPNPEADDKTSEKPAPPKSTRMPKVTLSRIPRNAKSYPAEELEDLSRGFLGRDRDGFRDVGPAGSVLVGVRVSFIEHFGGPKVRSVQPIYRSGKKHYPGRVHGFVAGPVKTVVARPGYAVGGLVTHTGLTVDGFGIVFMKVADDRLDPGDTYNSPWIGDKQGGNPGEVMSPGGLIVGLQGRSGNEVFALGLTARK